MNYIGHTIVLLIIIKKKISKLEILFSIFEQISFISISNKIYKINFVNLKEFKN